MIHIRSGLKGIYWQSWLKAYRLLHPWVSLGAGLKLYGLPIFVFPKSARVRIADDVVFRSGVRQNFVGLFKRSTICVRPEAELTILDHSGFSGVSIYCAKVIRIGKYLTCGGNVCIWDTDFHPMEYLARRQNVKELIKASPIIIGDDVFIGANSIILKGVTIGSRSIIGAGSVVATEVPPDEVWAGNPARFLKRLEPK
jgi:acetyltransferase-like isoleucine patch superfamily enzyme